MTKTKAKPAAKATARPAAKKPKKIAAKTIPAVKRKTGRPSGNTPAVAEAICERLGEGESLRAICSSPGMPSKSAVMRWLDGDPAFRDRYARAREIQAETLADELMEIADDGRNDWMEANDPNNPGYRVNGEHQARSRLRVDTRKWYLSKMLARKYGDKVDVTHGGSVAIERIERVIVDPEK